MQTLNGAAVAAGELTQTPHADRITSRLVFRFKDGSLDDETTVYSQVPGLHLISDHHVQKGPSFPHPYEVSIDTISQQVSVREDDKSAKVEHMELPSDLANGIVLTIVRNLLSSEGTGIEIPYLVVSPKPRIVKLAISPVGPDRFKVGRVSHQTTRFVIKIKLGGAVGVVAPLVGKQPADSYVWVTSGLVPTVVRVDAPLYSGGPIWSIQLATPVW